MAISSGGAVPCLLVEYRSPAEVAALRAAAAQRAGSSRHMGVRSAATLEVLDWIAGTGPAPLSGRGVVATEDTIVDERLLAQDAEDAAARSGGDHVRAGVIAQTLRWYERLAYTEAPVL